MWSDSESLFFNLARAKKTQMSIVKYFIKDNVKTFSNKQAVNDGWDAELNEEALIGLILEDRSNPKHKVKIKGLNYHLGTMIVHWEEGGWNCLDHAVEQFKRVGKK